VSFALYRKAAHKKLHMTALALLAILRCVEIGVVAADQTMSVNDCNLDYMETYDKHGVNSSGWKNQAGGTWRRPH
jgi:hypothetical protein